jgi:hypothetical protein
VLAFQSIEGLLEEAGRRITAGPESSDDHLEQATQCFQHIQNCLGLPENQRATISARALNAVDQIDVCGDLAPSTWGWSEWGARDQLISKGLGSFGRWQTSTSLQPHVLHPHVAAPWEPPYGSVGVVDNLHVCHRPSEPKPFESSRSLAPMCSTPHVDGAEGPANHRSFLQHHGPSRTIRRVPPDHPGRHLLVHGR